MRRENDGDMTRLTRLEWEALSYFLFEQLIPLDNVSLGCWFELKFMPLDTHEKIAIATAQ